MAGHNPQRSNTHHRYSRHTPPHFPTHNTQHKGSKTMQREAGQYKTPRPIRTRGHHSTHRTPPFNRTTTQTEGGLQHADGRDWHCGPPFIRHATHHTQHPPFRDSPTLHHDEGVAHRGYPTTRTPRRHTHHTALHTRQRNTTRHDRSTRTVRTGVDGIGRTHWTRETSTAHTTAIQQQHTPRKDGHHPLTSHCSRSHTNERS